MTPTLVVLLFCLVGVLNPRAAFGCLLGFTLIAVAMGWA